MLTALKRRAKISLPLRGGEWKIIFSKTISGLAERRCNYLEAIDGIALKKIIYHFRFVIEEDQCDPISLNVKCKITNGK
jgi:hypothetical protein